MSPASRSRRHRFRARIAHALTALGWLIGLPAEPTLDVPTWWSPPPARGARRGSRPASHHPVGSSPRARGPPAPQVFDGDAGHPAVNNPAVTQPSYSNPLPTRSTGPMPLGPTEPASPSSNTPAEGSYLPTST